MDDDKDLYNLSGIRTFPEEPRDILSFMTFYKPSNKYVK